MGHNIFDPDRVFYRAVTVFEIFSRPNFKVDLDQENGNILKNGFYQQIILYSKYPKREWAKKFLFFQNSISPLYLLRLNIDQLNHDEIEIGLDRFQVYSILLSPVILKYLCNVDLSYSSVLILPSNRN